MLGLQSSGLSGRDLYHEAVALMRSHATEVAPGRFEATSEIELPFGPDRLTIQKNSVVDSDPSTPDVVALKLRYSRALPCEFRAERAEKFGIHRPVCERDLIVGEWTENRRTWSEALRRHPARSVQVHGAYALDMVTGGGGLIFVGEHYREVDSRGKQKSADDGGAGSKSGPLQHLFARIIERW